MTNNEMDKMRFFGILWQLVGWLVGWLVIQVYGVARCVCVEVEVVPGMNECLSESGWRSETSRPCPCVPGLF